MSLTVKDILEKTFKKSFKGYDEDDVDKFLDEIIDEMKVLQGEIASIKNELEAEKQHSNKIRETEETIMHTLVSAQKSAERIMNEASRKAEIVLANAEATAKRRAEQTTRELSDSKDKLTEVKASATEFAERFTEMVRGTMESFEERYRDYFGEPEGGISVRALEKLDEDITTSLKEVDEAKTEFGEEIQDAEAVYEEQPEEPQQDREDDDEDPQSGGQAPEYEQAGQGTAPQETEKPDMGRLMEMNEINEALREIENSGEDILPESYENEEVQSPVRPAGDLDDYSWLYEDESSGVAFKDPKEKKALESLIDDIIE